MTYANFKSEIKASKTTDQIMLIGMKCSEYLDTKSIDELKEIARKRVRQIMGVL